MPDQLRVLFLAANPPETTKLRLDEEARAISAAIRNGGKRDAFDFRSEWAIRTADLQRVILFHKPQVLHFGGHGSKEPGLVLDDQTGKAINVDSEAITAVVRAAAPYIRIVVLNACASLGVIRRFRNIVDYTVGMDRPISDAAAIMFSAAFYEALASGTAVDKAFEWGVARLKTEGTGEADIPKLLKRRGLPTPPPPLVDPEPEPTPPPATAPAATTAGGATNNINLHDHARVKNFNVVNGDGTMIRG